MKRLILVTALSICSAVAAAATQSTSSTKISTTTVDTSNTVNGIRVELLVPMLEFKLSAMGRSFRESIDSTYGLGIGYAYLPIQDLGFTTRLSYLNAQENDDSVGIARLEGNLGTSLNQVVNLKGGLNMSKIVATSGGDISDYEMGFGFQASLGLQINKNFGLDLGYTQMNQTLGKSSTRSIDVDIELSGPEISLNGTF